MTPNLDRFRLPTAHDERDAEAELEVELVKADRWQDEKVNREADANINRHEHDDRGDN